MFKKILGSIYQELESPSSPTQLGKGWISGVIAVVLSLFCFLSVLCLSYPQLLTIPEVREVINADLFNAAIKILIVIAFVFSCISMILRQNKVLGLTSSSLIIFSIILGSLLENKSSVSSAEYYFAFDWFMLNLIITGMLFLPLERLFRRVDQGVFRFEWREDLFYFFISSIMVQSLTYLSMLPVTQLLTFSNLTAIQSWVSNQPIWLQFIEIMFLTDLVQYWVHRLFHQIPFLWGFHSVHHSAQKMDWLAGSRMHIMEIICLRGITIIPMYALGFQEPAIYAYIIVVYLYATYIHANLKFDIECLKPIIVTPRFHHWHHGIEKEAIDVNFAIHFPIFDKLFGTYYMPKDKWPSGYGVGGHPVPSGFINQFNYPFTRKR